MGGRTDDEMDSGAGVGLHGHGRSTHHPRQDVPASPDTSSGSQQTWLDGYSRKTLLCLALKRFGNF